jgi:hypothetical protein
MTLTKSDIIDSVYNQREFPRLKSTQLFADHPQVKDLIKAVSI